ncbi:MAG: S-methyl-5-thioribose-1-phosphate isomerase, partial [Actinomycetes bacterium]
ESTVDIETPNGDAIEIEDRDGGEVSQFGDFRVCPDGTPSINPAFDVTPVGLIDALVTDKRVVRFRLGEKLVYQ